MQTLFDHWFLEHPRNVGESYGQHLRAALGFSATLLAAGGQCLLHAFVPGLCQRSASRRVESLIARMQRRAEPVATSATPLPRA